jgi:hypothetical protein
MSLDTHQYYAYAPESSYNNSEVIQAICNVSTLLKKQTKDTGLPSVMVGEWALATGQ